jgi:hypothetical protein
MFSPLVKSREASSSLNDRGNRRIPSKLRVFFQICGDARRKIIRSSNVPAIDLVNSFCDYLLDTLVLCI